MPLVVTQEKQFFSSYMQILDIEIGGSISIGVLGRKTEDVYIGKAPAFASWYLHENFLRRIEPQGELDTTSTRRRRHRR